MSRQFDEYMGSMFELHGTTYELVEPKNFDELMQAIEVKGDIELAISELSIDEDASGLEDLLQIQDSYIKDYLDSLGEFDNTVLNSNISYLAKKNDLGIGNLEKLLGISAGYISRTAKGNSAKKMSIDVVWKIAKLFNIDLRTLLEVNQQIPNSNTEILAQFMNKLREQTECYEIEWANAGGDCVALDDAFEEARLVTEVENSTLYHPNRLNPDITFLLVSDIYVTDSIDEYRKLAVIPYRAEKQKTIHYDFVFIWNDMDHHNTDFGGWHWEKVFYTLDDPFGTLDKCATILYDRIQSTEYDAKITPEVRSMIYDYLKPKN